MEHSQIAAGEPPEQLYNQWIRDRMEFYKREVGAGGNPLGGEGGDPEGREPLGFVSQPCRMWESCDFFLPGLGCLWPRLRGGRGKGFS